MANRPIISIETDDASFQRFYDLFKAYEQKLADMPESWKRVDEAMSGAGRAFRKTAGATDAAMGAGAASAALIAEEMKKATAAQRHFHTATLHTQHAMKGVAGEVKNITAGLFSMSKHLLGLGALGIGAGSLLGGFGVDALAGAAFQRQRTARGLGMTPGQVASFGLNMGRYVDANSLLQTTANAKNDQSKWWAFAAMGIPVGQAQSESTGQLAMQEVNRARSIWKRGPHTLQYAQAHGLTEFFSLDDLRRLGNSSGVHLTAAEARTRRDAAGLGFSARTGREWALLDVQLRKAGLTIETSLIRGLAPLAPVLTRLSTEFAGLVTAAVPDIKKALVEFTKWLGSPEARADLKAFETGVEALGSRMMWLARLMGWVPTKPAPGALPGGAPAPAPSSWAAHHLFPLGTPNNNPANLRSAPGVPSTGGFAVFKTLDQGIAAASHQLGLYYNRDHLNTIQAIVSKWAPPGENNTAAYVKDVVSRTGLGAKQTLNLDDPATRSKVLSAMLWHESHLKASPAQVSADILRARRVQETVDAADQGSWQRRIATETARYTALPDSGPAATARFELGRQIADDRKHLASATQARARDEQMIAAMRRMSKPRAQPPAQVVIHNHTAARVAVSANAVAQ